MPATTQPTSHSQNTGLIVLVVGIFMVIVAFVAVTYLSSSKIDTVKSTQDKNATVGKAERSDITDITCALWRAVGDPNRVDPTLRAKVESICSGTSSSPSAGL